MSIYFTHNVFEVLRLHKEYLDDIDKNIIVVYDPIICQEYCYCIAYNSNHIPKKIYVSERLGLITLSTLDKQYLTIDIELRLKNNI